MAITDAEYDVLVAEAVKTLREKNEIVGANIVVKIVKHNRARALKAYDRFFEAERVKKEMENANAISPIVGAALIKDRQIHTAAEKENDKRHIEHLKSSNEILNEEIVSLQDELAAMQDQAANDGEVINVLQESNSHHKGQIQELHKQIETKTLELSAERMKCAEIFATVAELNQALGEKKYEAHAEQIRASDLQAQLEKMAKSLKETEKAYDDAKSKADQLLEKYTDLATRAQKTEKQLEDERKARLDAVAKHAEAKARAEVFEGQLAAMSKAQTYQVNASATAAREPAGDK